MNGDGQHPIINRQEGDSDREEKKRWIEFLTYPSSVVALELLAMKGITKRPMITILLAKIV